MFGALVGGLIGGGSAVVTESFATGSVTGQLSTGGLVGGTVSSIGEAYWDVEATGTETGIGGADDAGVTGLETAAMQGQEARQQTPGLDFTDTWTPETAPPDYPTFQWRRESCSAGRLTAPTTDTDPPENTSSDGSGSGFGLGSGLASAVVTAYLLWRRKQTD